MTANNTYQNVLPPGCTLDGYELLRVLGQGSFGVTYLAKDRTLQRQVAIKEYLPLEFAVRDPSRHTIRPLTGRHAQMYRWGLERFIAEGRTLARFRHPNIVTVHSLFEANNTAYMVMAYEQG